MFQIALGILAILVSAGAAIWVFRTQLVKPEPPVFQLPPAEAAVDGTQAL